MSNQEDPFRMDGGQPALGLADVDYQLVKPGKSIEDLGNREFRLIVLWTTIGQYHASAQLRNAEDGTDFNIDDARFLQLMSAWTKESREVYPTGRVGKDDGGFGKEITGLINDGLLVNAYEKLIDMRSWAPEVVHPDLRFDFFDDINTMAQQRPENDFLSELVFREMVDETIPGGLGFCDNPERLRRYDMLAKTDPLYEELVASFIVGLLDDTPPARTDYFDENPLSVDKLCQTVAAREHRALAQILMGNPRIGTENELVLIPLL